MSFGSLAIVALLSTAAVAAPQSDGAASGNPPESKEQRHGCCDRMNDQQRQHCEQMMRSHATAPTTDATEVPGGGA